MTKELNPPLGSLDWGALRQQEPASRWWGLERGQPIDRHYIEGFLAANKLDVRGRCIEVLNSRYIESYGDDRVTRTDIVDIDQENSLATIVGDLTDPATLPKATFDCFILTQTLSAIYHAGAALENCYASLKPGGALLVTVPALCRYSPHPEDHWRFTKDSFSAMIREFTDCQNWTVTTHGNLIASLAFLVGLSTQELTLEELDHFDEHYPISIVARLVKH